MMADKDLNILKQKLEQLKAEEKLINELLKDVETEIDRYEVENLHLAGLNEKQDSGDESDNLYIDEQTGNYAEIDSESEINVKPVDLGFRNDLLNKEEFDEDDEDESDGN